MSIDFQTLPHEGIRTLKPYIPGKSIASLAQEQGLKDIIKLASNENPLGTSPLAQHALATMSSVDIATYPSPYIHPLMEKLASHLAIPLDHLIISNGSDFIFTLLLASFALHTNKHLLTHDYAFSTYAIQAKTLGIPIVSAPIHSNWEVNIDALIKACNHQTGLLCLANPNNPTGTMANPEAIKYLAENIPESTLLVVDEAYYEYAQMLYPYNAIPWLDSHPNLVLTRTFSKIYGMAGLRLGYAIANEDIINILKRVQLPFTINQAALVAGCAALDDHDFITKTLELTEKGMQQMLAGLENLNLKSIPSAGNFVTFDCEKDALPIYQGLLNQGIIVRPLHPYNMPNHLRVTIGNKEQNDRFINALEGILK